MINTSNILPVKLQREAPFATAIILDFYRYIIWQKNYNHYHEIAASFSPYKLKGFEPK